MQPTGFMSLWKVFTARLLGTLVYTHWAILFSSISYQRVQTCSTYVNQVSGHIKIGLDSGQPFWFPRWASLLILCLDLKNYWFLNKYIVRRIVSVTSIRMFLKVLKNLWGQDLYRLTEDLDLLLTIWAHFFSMRVKVWNDLMRKIL